MTKYSLQSFPWQCAIIDHCPQHLDPVPAMRVLIHSSNGAHIPDQLKGTLPTTHHGETFLLS